MDVSSGSTAAFVPTSHFFDGTPLQHSHDSILQEGTVCNPVVDKGLQVAYERKDKCLHKMMIASHPSGS